MKKIVFALIMFTMLLASTASAATVNLAWDANTEIDLAGYKLYQSATTGGPYTLVQTLAKVTTVAIPNLVDGRYYWVLTAFDASGNESGYSNEVSKTIDTFPPALPKNLRVAP